MRIHSFKPWRLALEQVGPFRDAIEHIHFVNRNREPANLFMLAAHNGKGKTTALECMVLLFAMLSDGFQGQDWSGHTLLRDPGARAQLDLFATLSHERQLEVRYLISLSFGIEGSEQLFGEATLDTDSVESLTQGQAERRCRIGCILDPLTGKLVMTPLQHSLSSTSLSAEERGAEEREAQAVMTALRAFTASTPQGTPYSAFSPLAREDEQPTLLYFTAHRDVVAIASRQARLCEPELPEYQVTQTFGADGHEWATSLSNLLVWYYWMSPRLYFEVREYVNKVLFEGESGKGLGEEPHKRPPGVDVTTVTGTHRLEHLSSGERNLVQFFVRVGAHATRHTIIVIDELENHLHPRFQALLMQRIKESLQARPWWTVIFTSHSRDTIAAFDAFTEEAGIRKGGELLDSGRF